MILNHFVSMCFFFHVIVIVYCKTKSLLLYAQDLYKCMCLLLFFSTLFFVCIFSVYQVSYSFFDAAIEYNILVEVIIF